MRQALAEKASQATDGVELSTLPFGLILELHVADAELVKELQTFPEGKPRDEYALCALRIGLLALKQARGEVDADTVRREGERLLGTLDNRLTLHAQGLENLLTNSLKEYFDPESGRLHERVQRLVKRDGELEDVLRRQIGQQDSELCRTLAAHVGAQSPLMRMLSPRESEGILKLMSDTLSEQLRLQRERVLGEFSLDNADGALCRLVKKLTDHHGDLSNDLQNRLNDVVGEFSLDKKDSALSRLVRRVTKAQRTISSEFSLDNESSALSRMSKCLENTSQAINSHLTLDREDSALSRLKRELLELLNNHSDVNRQFQEEVKRSLAEMQIRRAAVQRSPEHGREFEQVVFEFVQREAQRTGELVSFTGDTVGEIKNCKVGDTVIEMGPDHVACGARIVIESKNKEGYTLLKARDEMEQARKNRGACVGLFVFSRATAPEGLEMFQRLGDDLFVIWDAEDPDSDLFLRAGLMVTRALCSRQAKQRAAHAADFAGIEKAILDIEKKAGSLDEIREAAESINGQTDRILKRVRLARKGIEDQTETLRELMGDLKGEFMGESTPHTQE